MALFDFEKSKRYQIEETRVEGYAPSLKSPSPHYEEQIVPQTYSINIATLQDGSNDLPHALEKQQPHKGKEAGLQYSTPPTTPTLLQKIGAEVVSTFILIFVSCGAVMAHDQNKETLTQLGVYIATGTVVVMMIYSVGHISGAHMNPAVTLAFATKGFFPWTEVPIYIISQMSASICACYTLQQVFGSSVRVTITMPMGPLIQSLLIETIITFILMLVVAAVSSDNHAVGELGGVVVGGTVLTNNLLAGPISGASMNPARSLGPAIVSGAYTSLWVYFIAPPIGAMIGIWTYHFIFLPSQSSQVALEISTKQEK